MAKRIPGILLDGTLPDGTVVKAPVYNENEVRAAAGLTMAAGTYAFVYAYFDKEFLPIKVVSTLFFVDFLIRVFAGLQYSPVGVVAHLLKGRSEPMWVSAKPKRFAWSMGLVMSGAMTVITNSNITGTLPRTICLICITLMWMEAVLGFCVGCELYGFLVRRDLIARDEQIEICASGACALPPRAPTVPVATATAPPLEAPPTAAPPRPDRPLVASGA